MAIIKQTTLTSIGTILSTEMNSIANAGLSNAGSTIDLRTTNRYTSYTVRWTNSNTFGSPPSSGGAIVLYALPSTDGTNFPLGSSSVLPSDNFRIATFLLSTVTTAGQLITVPDIPGTVLLPLQTRFMIRNLSGQTLPSSGNTIELFGINIESA